ncbi:MAG: glycosyltransferase, partial [Planctomycetes bacterium]|nr:glycosyltransferase [Planctomycetota bacterium]
MQPDPVELGPDNWFVAWWLTGAERQPTRLRRDDQGRLVLLELPHRELKFVAAILVRAWCDGPKDWSSPDWAELAEFEQQVLSHLDALRRSGGAKASGGLLAFPPMEHAMFHPDGPCLLLSELWRLGDHEGLRAWLGAVVSRRTFPSLSRRNVALRRLAVEAARRVPGPAVFEQLRRIYRDQRTSAAVIAADRQFLTTSGAETFATALAELGLHAPRARKKFSTLRRGKARTDDGAQARITVLIPSYRHEAYVAAAIESCLRQSVAVKVLVVDDRSPDGTVAAAAAVAVGDARVEVRSNERNLGLGASVLAALASIDTPYVALLNSDDLYHPDRLRRCLELFEQDAGVCLVATAFAVVDRAGCVLTAATACAADIGPKALGWLRWHEGIVRDELHAPADWVALPVLLRHNVLATSSNMVFRTDWLRAQMLEASRLKYCLDWQLFLQAAMEGSLRMVPETLLAYRLHDSNTVWFREGGEADYVVEVNRVVDHVLDQWLSRAIVADGAAKALERFAGLLTSDVRAHGETDDAILYLCDLARRHAVGSIDTGSETIISMAASALRSKMYGRVMQQLPGDPWSLPWRVQLADRWQLEHDVAEGYAARARSLEQTSERLREELQESRRGLREAREHGERLAHERQQAAAGLESIQQRLQAADREAAARIESMRGRLEAAAREAASVKTAAAERERGLERQLADIRREAAAKATALADTRREAAAKATALADQVRELEQRLVAADLGAQTAAARIAEQTTELARCAGQLERAQAEAERLVVELRIEQESHAATRGALAADRKELANVRTSAEQLATDLQATRADLAATAAELVRVRIEFEQEAASLRQQIGGLHREIETLRAELERLGTMLTGVRAERDAALAATNRANRLLDLAVRHAASRQARWEDLLRSPAQRLGGVLLRRVGLLGAYKTLAAAAGSVRALLQRGSLHVGRVLAPEGRERRRVVGLLDADSSGRLDDRIRRAAGVHGQAPIWLGWRHQLAPHDPVPGAVWLADEARLAARDRRYFVQRNRAGVDTLERLIGSSDWVGGGFRIARAAKSLGAGLVLVVGLRAAAVQALAAARLCGVRFVLVLGDEDLVAPALAPAAVAAIVRAASLLVVDSELVLRAAERLGDCRAERVIVQWAPRATEPWTPVPATDGVRILVSWSAPGRADPATLVEAIRQAVAGGSNLWVDIVADFGVGGPALRRVIELEERVAAAGLGARVSWHGNAPAAQRLELRRRASMVLWPARSAAAAGLPVDVTAALAAGQV